MTCDSHEKLSGDVDSIFASPGEKSPFSLTPTSSEPDESGDWMSTFKQRHAEVMKLSPQEKMLLVSVLTHEAATTASFNHRIEEKEIPGSISSAAFNGFCTGTCTCPECPRGPLAPTAHYPTTNIPWAGRTYVIVLNDKTDRVLNSSENLYLSKRDDDNDFTHWYCHVTTDGWFTFRNVHTSLYMGYERKYWQLIARASNPRDWEHMQVRLHPSGLFEIYCRVDGAMKGISTGLTVGGQIARWRFVQVDF